MSRPKDVIRLQQFYIEAVYEPEKLDALLQKHGWGNKWQKLLALFNQGGKTYVSESELS